MSQGFDPKAYFTPKRVLRGLAAGAGLVAVYALSTWLLFGDTPSALFGLIVFGFGAGMGMTRGPS
jgi:hypothetical protein